MSSRQQVLNTSIFQAMEGTWSLIMGPTWCQVKSQMLQLEVDRLDTRLSSQVQLQVIEVSHQVQDNALLLIADRLQNQERENNAKT